VNDRIRKHFRSLDTGNLEQRIAKRERGETQEPARKADVTERMQHDPLFAYWKLANKFWWTA
jgi:hypothetical protein